MLEQNGSGLLSIPIFLRFEEEHVRKKEKKYDGKTEGNDL